jgi:hypothetical protein
MLDLMLGDEYRNFAPYVVIGSFRVDVHSQNFQHWVRSRMVRDEEGATLEFLTDSGRRINSTTPFFRSIMSNEFSDSTIMLTSRIFRDTKDKDRDPRKYSFFFSFFLDQNTVYINRTPML